ncbi:MAG TPA: LamG domain-containing protein [Thermoguttaceae bacterium]|nr:LamG domain-containing protein [Thermoguttaceae bacterium]
MSLKCLSMLVRLGWVVVVLTAATVSTSQAALMHHWKLDESGSASVAVDSVGGADATITGGGLTPTYSWVPGQIGNAMEVAWKGGPNTWAYADAGNINIASSFTVSFWAKPYNVNDDWRNMVGKNDVSGNFAFWVGQHENNGYLRFGLYFDGSTETSLDTSSAVLEDNKWYFITAVWDEVHMVQKLYVNGVEVASATRTGQSFAIPRSSNFRIHGKSNDDTNQFYGLVDDVQIYNIPLRPVDIMAMYQQPGSTAPVDVRSWDFESGTLEGFSVVPGTGSAFDGNPVHVNDVSDESGVVGDWFVRSDHSHGPPSAKIGDSPTGVLETAPFVLWKDAVLNFRIAGGYHPWQSGWDPDNLTGVDATAITLERLVGPGNWEVLLWATGDDTTSLDPFQWDLSAYAGQMVRLRIYDLNTGGWGHIAVDAIRLMQTVPEPNSAVLLAAAFLMGFVVLGRSVDRRRLVGRRKSACTEKEFA